jgi:hypothetical protein
MRVIRSGTGLLAACAFILATSSTVLGARTNTIVRINNANAWFIVHAVDDPCQFDQITLTLAQDYSKSPRSPGTPPFNTWADVSFGHWSGCDDPALVSGSEMYGTVQLEADVDAAVNGLESAWMDGTIIVEGGGATRTFTFDLSWIAAGQPTTFVDSDGVNSWNGRGVAARLTGTVTDSDGVFSMAALDRAELSEVNVRLR